MRAALVLLVLLAGCGRADDDCLPCAESDAGAGPPDAARCHEAPSTDDPKVVVSLPYDAAGGQASTYRVLDLDSDGALTDSGTSFEMGRSLDGEIVFTPDGEIGLVAQEDGSIGVFHIESQGVQVVHARFEGSFYATRIVVDATGGGAWVLDGNWRENGGGIYSLAIACDGTLTDHGRWVEAKLPAGLHLLDDHAVLVATDVAASPAGDDAHLLDWSAWPQPLLIDGADGFGDDEAIIASSAVTADRELLLIGDNSAFSGVPNRVAVLGIAGKGLTARQVLTPIEDPVAILPSPHDDVALVVSGFGDAIFVLDREATATAPFSLRGELTYDGASPQLPGAAVLVQREALRGLALIAENQGVRSVMMSGDGVVTDRGLFPLGDGTEFITGAIGVQP